MIVLARETVMAQQWLQVRCVTRVGFAFGCMLLFSMLMTQEELLYADNLTHITQPRQGIASISHISCIIKIPILMTSCYAKIRVMTWLLFYHLLPQVSCTYVCITFLQLYALCTPLKQTFWQIPWAALAKNSIRHKWKLMCCHEYSIVLWKYTALTKVKALYTSCRFAMYCSS